MNRVILIGRLTREPELRYTPAGHAVATFTLAVDRQHGTGAEKRADFISIVAWNKTAENCAEYLKKGSLAAVDGRLQVRTYDDKQDQKRWVTEVVAESVRFLSKKETPAEPLGQEVPFDENDIPF